MALAYLVIRSFILEPAGFTHSRHITTKLYESFGARFLVRSDQVKTLAGKGVDFALTVAEFPSMAAVERVLVSPESGALHQDATHKAVLDIWAASGVEVPESATPAVGPRGYIVGRVQDEDPERFKALGRRMGAASASYAGRYLIQTDAVQVAAGSSVVRGLVLVEFPSLEQLHDTLRRSESQQRPGPAFRDDPSDLWIAPGMGQV